MRPLNIDRIQNIQNVVVTVSSDDNNINHIEKPSDVKSNTLKSSLRISERTGKLDKKKSKKKKVRFSDAESPEGTSFLQRLVHFVHFIWKCIRTTSKVAFGKIKNIFKRIFLETRFKHDAQFFTTLLTLLTLRKDYPNKKATKKLLFREFVRY